MSEFVPGPDTARDFRDALGRFATGVTLVTTGTEHGPLGIVANSFASVSLDPPLVLWSPARSSRRFAAFEGAERYAIHVLSDAQQPICAEFAKEGRAFDGLEWTADAHGTPLVGGCLARFDCVRHAIHDGGDHAIIVGRVERANLGDGAPLVFSQGGYGAFSAD